MTAALALPLPTLALLCIRNANQGTKHILAAMVLSRCSCSRFFFRGKRYAAAAALPLSS
jgi:hypothetical protein